MNRKLCLGLLLGCVLPASAAAADDAPRFSRHVAAVFSRLGCNGGTCHGAVQGQNGFKLTLFGANPELDYARLTREFGGRRLNFQDADSSLLLMKAINRVPHVGGKRMETTSPEYDILRRWIAAGAPADSLDPSRLAELRITPAQQTVQPGESYRLKVEAKFADGSVEDVTALCSYSTLDQQVAQVGRDGTVEAKGVGDTALIVRFRSDPAVASVIVPRPGGGAFPDAKPANFIDQHVLAKLRRLNIPPSVQADDATFLRRVTLDLTGELPAPKEIRAFLADQGPDKRAKKIDELLARPGYAALWTLKFSDLLKAADFGVYADALRQEADAPRFQAWLRARLEENLPYDQLVERILTATSREGRSVEDWSQEVIALLEGYAPGRKDLEVYKQRKTLDLYWQRGSASGVPGTLQIAHAFLGLRLECAQCHRHPHDVWQQDDLLSFANFFMRVRKPGFQGDNEKKFPDTAKMSKQFAAEGKQLAEQAKKLREGELKKLEADLKQAKDGEKADLQTSLDKLKREVTEMERRGKMLPECGTRILHAEIRDLGDAKTFASVTSPLGKQSSSQYRLLGEAKPVEIPPGQDPREALVAWLKKPDNPYFARAIVNRVWAHYFGRGIVDPPDHLSPLNPASHPELLKELAEQFVKHGYDLKWLHRAIATSRTYQQSSTASEANEMDRANYAFFAYRRLPAEVLVDALNQATGTSENLDMKYNHWPDQMKIVEIPYAPRNAFVAFMLENFGRPKRNSAVQCDCERESGASLLQVLSFANHPRVWAKISDANGQAARIVKEIGDDNQRIEEVFLCTLSRLPAEAEKQACLKYLKESESPTKGLQGIMWSLLNTREFVLQH